MDAKKKGRIQAILEYLEDDVPSPPEEERRPIRFFPEEDLQGKLANRLMPEHHYPTEEEYEALWNQPVPPDEEPPTPVTTRRHLARKRAKYEA